MAKNNREHGNEIRRSFSLSVVKKGADMICYDLMTLQLILGTSSVSGNFRLYGVRREKGSFIVGVDKIKERISELERRKNRLEESLNVMKQVLG